MHTPLLCTSPALLSREGWPKGRGMKLSVQTPPWHLGKGAEVRRTLVRGHRGGRPCQGAKLRQN